jgi:hypothetical protein
MMKARTLAFLAVLALVGAPVMMAQTPATDPAATPAGALAPLQASDPTAPSIEGSVVSIGNTSLVITADDGSTRTFVMDTATVLPTTEVASGSRVLVHYKPLDADRAQALSVNSVLAPPASGSAAPAGSGAPASEAPAPLPERGLVSPLAMGIGGLVVLAVIILMVTRRRPTDEAFHIG